MNSIANPARYQSVSLFGNEKLLSFVNRLASFSALPVIHHLFIAGLQVRYIQMTELGDQYTFERWREMQEETRAYISKLSVNVHTILVTLAPHLRTLGIHGWNVDLTADTLPAFPFLHDITSTSKPRHSVTSPTRFPSLRRVHIRARSAHPAFWLVLAHFAPRATHLRLSGVCEDAHTPRFLRVLLDLPPGHAATADSYAAGSPEAARAVALAARFPHLAHVSVQPAPYSDAGGADVHASMEAALAGLAAASARGQGVGMFVLLPEQHSYTAEEARRDWLDVVEGGDGPWPPAPDGNASPAVRAKWAEEGNAYLA
ncbi:hypothetical protein PsYK624_045210 [Phanerochaete sordida]|uniref:Uncharacterized protein n=1 Tax=Phanerochaete sordida TaxID=48140 RepID=A0A9P3LBT7_9APHY|nr:hypothetical protein PsYK624_045210 [Phanerochaete sordida]